MHTRPVAHPADVTNIYSTRSIALLKAAIRSVTSLLEVRWLAGTRLTHRRIHDVRG